MFRRAQPRLDDAFVGIRVDLHCHIDVLQSSAAVFLTSECRFIEFTVDNERNVVDIEIHLTGDLLAGHIETPRLCRQQVFEGFGPSFAPPISSGSSTVNLKSRTSTVVCVGLLRRASTSMFMTLLDWLIATALMTWHKYLRLAHSGGNQTGVNRIDSPVE